MKNKGFTLIELSIVLIIISLIVGGIVGGKSLIHSAEISKIASKIEGYKTAINVFYDQYDAFPGDLNNADEYWPVECVDEVTNYCNGNNDGQIYNLAGLSRESLRAWQHMTLADIMPGSYTGLGAGAIFPSIEAVEESIPTGPLRSVFTIFHTNNAPANGKIGNYIRVAGLFQFGANVLPIGGLLKPSDAKKIDRKMDDGSADGGILRSENGFSDGGGALTGCLAGGAATGDYDLSTVTNDCVVYAFFN